MRSDPGVYLALDRKLTPNTHPGGWMTLPGLFSDSFASSALYPTTHLFLLCILWTPILSSKFSFYERHNDPLRTIFESRVHLFFSPQGYGRNREFPAFGSEPPVTDLIL